MNSDVNPGLESQGRRVRLRSQFAWMLVIVFALGGPMIWFHRASNRNLISFHGSLHTAISQRFVDNEFPPENPYFAGESVRYYWPYHYLGYLLSQVTGQNVLYSFELISFVGLTALAMASVAVGRMIFRSAASGAIVALFVLAGSNPFGWIIAAAKYLRDGPRVLGDVSQGVTGPMLYLVQFGDHRLGPNFTYWIHTTARAASLGFAIVALVVVFYALCKPRLCVMAAVAISLAVSTAINPLIGLACCGALVVGLLSTYVLLRVWPRQLSDPISSRVLLSILFSIMLGSVLVLPTYWHMIGSGTSSSIHIDPFRLKHWVSIGVNGLPLLLLGVFGTVQAGLAFRLPLLISLFGGLALLLLTGLFRMPGTIPTSLVVGNEHNFFNVACVFLAIPATATLIRLRHGVWQLSKKRVVLAALLFLPTPLVVMSAYAARPSYDVALKQDRMAINDADDPYGSAYNWLYDNAEQDAVVVMLPDETRQRLCNTSDLPAMTGRVLFVDHASYMTDMYPEFSRRCALAKELTEGTHLSDADVAYIQQLGKPVYVIGEIQADTDYRARLSQRYGLPLYDGGSVQIYRWKS